jgi:hypothetical protein
MKWLVARYPKPPGTMIKLGSILKDAAEPESSLNLESTTGIKTPTNVRDESVAIRATITSELSTSLSALLAVDAPTNPLVEAAVKLQGDKSKSAETVVEAMNVKANIFLPTKEYMKDALADPEVIAYVKEGSLAFSKPVYLIIGVAKAEKLNLKEKLEKQASASAKAGVGAAGGAGKAEAELSGEQKEKLAVEREIEVECDFAYRAREIVYSKMTIKKEKWSKGKDVTEGTMFRTGGEQSGDQKKEIVEEEVPVFDEFMEDDEVPKDVFAVTS